MPLKNGRFTLQERRFIDAMARTGDAPYAAWKAGAAYPKTAGYQIMSKPAVRAEVIRQAEEALYAMLPAGLATHKFLMETASVPAGARLGAVKLLYDRTLGSGEKDESTLEPSEMTAGELQRSIARAQAELEGRPIRAKDVTPKPVDRGVFE